MSARSIEAELILIERFIHSLPLEYRGVALLIRMTAIDPQKAISLTVPSVQEAWSLFGRSHSVQRICGSVVPPDRDAEFLLAVQIRGRRKAALKRNRVPPEQEPEEVFLDRNARPITMKSLDEAFLRTARRLKLAHPISPTSMRKTILKYWGVSSDCTF